MSAAVAAFSRRCSSDLFTTDSPQLHCRPLLRSFGPRLIHKTKLLFSLPVNPSPLSAEPWLLTPRACARYVPGQSLARMGAVVMGVDATEHNIRIARAHTGADPILEARIDYKAIAVEELSEQGEEFDAVMCLEVVEHVIGPEEFCTTLGSLVKVPSPLSMRGCRGCEGSDGKGVWDT